MKFNKYGTLRGSYINFSLLYTKPDNNQEGYGLIQNPNQGIFIWTELKLPYDYSYNSTTKNTIWFDYGRQYHYGKSPTNVYRCDEFLKFN